MLTPGHILLKLHFPHYFFPPTAIFVWYRLFCYHNDVKGNEGCCCFLVLHRYMFVMMENFPQEMNYQLPSPCQTLSSRITYNNCMLLHLLIVYTTEIYFR